MDLSSLATASDYVAHASLPYLEHPTSFRGLSEQKLLKSIRLAQTPKFTGEKPAATAKARPANNAGWGGVSLRVDAAFRGW